MGLCARGGGCPKVMGVYYIIKKLKAKKLAHEKNQGHFSTEKLNVSETFSYISQMDMRYETLFFVGLMPLKGIFSHI